MKKKTRSNKPVMILGGFLIAAGLGLIILVALIGFQILPVQGSSNQSASNVLKIGSPPPNFELETLAGERVQLSDLKGKTVLINFWATWCDPCKLEMPYIQNRYARYDSDLVVLAVNDAEPASRVQPFVDDYGLTFDVLLDPQAAVQDLYQVYAFPTTYLVDAQGILRVKHVGLMSEDQLDQYLSEVGVGK